MNHAHNPPQPQFAIVLYVLVLRVAKEVVEHPRRHINTTLADVVHAQRGRFDCAHWWLDTVFFNMEAHRLPQSKMGLHDSHPLSWEPLRDRVVIAPVNEVGELLPK